MANTLLTVDMITKDALMVAENELTLGKNVRRQYDDQYAKRGGNPQIGDTLRVRKPAKYVVTTGATFTSNPDSYEESVDLQVAYQEHVGLRFTSAEQTMDIQDYRRQFLRPAVAALMNKVDTRIAALYTKIYSAVGTAGTVPNDSSVYLAAGAQLDNQAVPRMDRANVMAPFAAAALVRANQGLTEDAKSIAQQYLNGNIGRAHGFRNSMDQNIATHTFGAWAGTPVVNDGSISEGDTSIILGGFTSTTGTIAAGDLFTIADVYEVNPQNRQSTGELQKFVATAAANAAGGDATVSISPALLPADSSTETIKQRATIDTLPVTGAAVTILGPASTQSKQGLAFHPDAISLVTADLIFPDSIPASGKSRISDNQLGLALRLVKFYDGSNDRENCRLDIFYGVELIRPEWACRVLN